MNLNLDPYTAALLISFIPIMMLSVYVLAFHQLDKRGLSFFIFTITLTQFYIVAIDPSLAGALYTSKGNYWFPIAISVLSGFLLLVAFVSGRRTVQARL